MALTDDNGALNTTMLVSPTGNMGGYPYPVYQGNGGGNNNGFGQDGWWIILLIIIIAAGGWGNNNNGNGGGFGGQPIIVNDGSSNGAIQRGFDQAAVMAGINGVQTGVQNLSTQLCGCCGDMQMSLANGFAGVNASINGAQNAIAAQLYSNQISDLERSFAAQTASMQGMNAIQGQLAQAGADNRLATNDVKYTIATEACSTRATDTQNTQAILNAINDGFRFMNEQRYQDKIDAKNDEIAQLRQENLYARGQASQIAQDQRIVDGIYNRLATCPVDTTPVFGRSPIFTCATNLSNTNIGGCSCGCGNGSF